MSPQPRRSAAAAAQEPPPPPQNTSGAAAAGAGAAAVGGAAAAGPAAQSVAAVAAAAAARAAIKAVVPSGGPSDAAVAASVYTLLQATDALFRERRATFAQHVAEVARQQMPGAPQERIDQLAQEELRREVVFQRKARQRLQVDLPRALKIADPTERASEVAKVLEREKRYLRQRETAAAQRLVAALEMDLVRHASPEGAFWVLSPLLREHCVKCLAMAGKFWPWEVLDLPDMHLPQHTNCGCRLLTLEEAIGQGLMAADQIPDTADAIKRAKALMREANRLQETLAPEELDEVVAELEHARIQEVSARDLLRWGKGVEHGGEFRPRGGGNPGKSLLDTSGEAAKLRQLARSESPVTARLAKRGRHVQLKGEDHFVPQADAWQAKVKGHTYSSPPGGTNLYRDGILVGHDHEDLRHPEALPPDPMFKRPPGQPVGDHTYHPDPIARPSREKPIPDYTGAELTVGKGAGGSTGARWAFDGQGNRWLLKGYGGDRDRVATELLANAIYRDMGAAVPPAGQLRTEDGTLLAYPTVDGAPRHIDSPSTQLGAHYMTDALVANWDFIGLTDDNVLWTAEGDPVRLDQGGTLQYRAQGEPKPYGPVPTEVWTMLSPRGQGFGKAEVNETEMADQARVIGERLPDERIDQLVDAAPFEDTKMREQVRGSLKARVQWMRDFAKGDEQLPRPLEGQAARSQLRQWQERVQPFPEQQAAVEAFEAVPEPLQEMLRQGTPTDRVPEQARNIVARIDQLQRQVRTDEDVTLYKPIDPAKLGNLGVLPGKVLRDPAYLNATSRISAAREAPAYLQLTVPAGTRALFMDALTDPDPGHLPDPDMEVLLPRNSRVLVHSVERRAGRTVVRGTVMPT